MPCTSSQNLECCYECVDCYADTICMKARTNSDEMLCCILHCIIGIPEVVCYLGSCGCCCWMPKKQRLAHYELEMNPPIEPPRQSMELDLTERYILEFYYTNILQMHNLVLQDKVVEMMKQYESRRNEIRVEIRDTPFKVTNKIVPLEFNVRIDDKSRVQHQILEHMHRLQALIDRRDTLEDAKKQLEEYRKEIRAKADAILQKMNPLPPYQDQPPEFTTASAPPEVKEQPQQMYVLDTCNKWLPVDILEKKDNKVRIHYQRWDSKWDEWLPLDSPRIEYRVVLHSS